MIAIKVYLYIYILFKKYYFIFSDEVIKQQIFNQ
jgi:hypothetical protein